MPKIRAAIVGVGGYVPDYILSNKELESMVDTTDDWIVSRTGIRERRILKGDNLGTSYMAVKAVNDLLKKTDTNPEEIDLIIVATVTPDMPFPATANIVAAEIGATNSFSFDISAACSGFLYGLTTAARYIESGACKRVLLIGGDKMSSIVNYRDRTTCVIFGDGAGCVLLEPTTEPVGVLDMLNRVDGKGANFLHMKAGGSRLPATSLTVKDELHYVHQVGNIVFKCAVANMIDITTKVLERNNLQVGDIDWFTPHQANRRILKAITEKMSFSQNQVLINIDRYGNTTAATIPLLLWDYEKCFKKGDNMIMSAFGGGFAWGSVLVKWAYDTSQRN